MTGATWLRGWVLEGDAFYNSKEQVEGGKKGGGGVRVVGVGGRRQKRRVFGWDP